MAKRARNKKVEAAIVAAVITAIGVIIAAIINAHAGGKRGNTFSKSQIGSAAVISGNTGSVSIENKTINGPVFNTSGNSNTINYTVPPRTGTNAVLSLPHVLIETLSGIPPELGKAPHFRMNRLLIRNNSNVDLENFCSHIQLPEPILEANSDIRSPPGTIVGWRPLRDSILIAGTGGRTDSGLWLGPTSSVEFVSPEPCFRPRHHAGMEIMTSRAGDLTGTWELTLNKLQPGRFVTLLFLTSNGTNTQHYIEYAAGKAQPIATLKPDQLSSSYTNELRSFMQGGYAYTVDSTIQWGEFFVPIKFDSVSRKLASLAVQSNVEPWEMVYLDFP